MPQNKSSPEPKVMTWGKAAPALIVAAIFDALRLMFEWFIFFGPALVAIYCTVKVNGVLTAVTFGLLGAKAAGAACSVGAIAAAVAGATAFESFGFIMAMATGFAGWLIVGGWLMVTNARIFKENALWFVGSLFISEVPFVNSLPAITVAVWKMYHTQIKKEKTAHEKWEKENADAQLQERNQRAAQIMQAQAVQMQVQEAANEATYAEAASEEEIPEEVRKAA